MRRPALLIGGLAALVLLDPAVSAWANARPGMSLLQHALLALSGVLLALGSRPAARHAAQARARHNEAASSAR